MLRCKELQLEQIKKFLWIYYIIIAKFFKLRNFSRKRCRPTTEHTQTHTIFIYIYIRARVCVCARRKRTRLYIIYKYLHDREIYGIVMFIQRCCMGWRRSYYYNILFRVCIHII